MKLWQDWEDAVSPVIGVILMVAITVILAAVIAAFVFGMIGPLHLTRTVAATATQAGNNIVVTYQGGPDQMDVTPDSLNITITASDGTVITSPGMGAGHFNWGTTVGNATTFGGGTSGHDHVTVAVGFNDGTGQVILDTFV